MVDIATITAVLGAASTGAKTTGAAVDIASKLKDLFGKDGDNEAKALAGELAEQLYQVRIANLEVLTKLQELQRQAEKENEFRAIRALYAPFALPSGGKVLKLKESDEDTTEYWQFVCPACTEQYQKLFPLQGKEDSFSLKCPNCGSEFENAPWNPMM